ncbi:hypothetical protein ATK17_2824 [Branchiibius hedensis]|uniref:BD-FAE-like domain-containing protein n=1 Tax=Branchiibius hedensis TaxID=672460 RepID=A0A2Y8ZSV6_9MICO|nr:subtype A tannase [Branchiibius hedensis]PWJ26650.1 hypothetical protein ATK17_2824 [Branchiibius hedensis]SSA35461.1 hypothetical protein SAMN04489750_2824 [Branchiibius hedensis]
MRISRRAAVQGVVASAAAGVALAACSDETGTAAATSTATTATAVAAGSLAFNSKGWSYDSTNDVYYQLGISYAAKPAAKDYETLGVYVPGKYLTATKNSDGSYTATVNESGSVSGFTARTAPIVLPVNTPGYAAQKPPTKYSYNDVSSYLKAGFVYVAPGLRGRDSQSNSYHGNAPWGVTDLKATIRYVRLNLADLPGRKDAVYVFGMSGGGAESVIAGAAGDSDLYTAHLNSIGAAMADSSGAAISDAVNGVMAWCPITNLDYGNAAYEWNMGQFATTGTRASGTWTAAYSGDLADSFAAYVNKLALKDSSGTNLSLATSSSGHYLSGSYYDHLIEVLTQSLNNFLSDTTFPYTPNNQTMAGMGGAGAPGGSGGPPSGGAPSGAPTGSAPSGGTAPSGGSAASGGTSGSSSTTYKTVADYIDYLNSDSTWVKYDTTTKKATVLNLSGFVTSQKTPSKEVGAFDGPDRSRTENVVLGSGTTGLHFAQNSKDVIAAHQSSYAKLTNWKSAYAASEYATDFAKTDSVGTTTLVRQDMYNPMYYLSDFYKGYKTSTVAPHWRIRTGVMQGDTANTTEINLALALADLGIDSLDFATVWGLGHTMAERTGDATTNFIAWVKKTAAA